MFELTTGTTGVLVRQADDTTDRALVDVEDEASARRPNRAVRPG